MATNLKYSARNRKGRGFLDISNTILEENEPFERIRPCNKPKLYGTGTPEKSVEGWCVFVTGIHQEALEDDLKETFSDYGKILNIHANLDRRTGFLKGYALLEFNTFQEASESIENLNGVDFLGQRLEVSWCFVKTQLH